MMGLSHSGHVTQFWPMRPKQKVFALLTNEVKAGMTFAIIFLP